MIDSKELLLVTDFLESKPLSLTTRMTFYIKDVLFSTMKWSGSKLYQVFFDSEEEDVASEAGKQGQGAALDSTRGQPLDREWIVMASVKASIAFESRLIRFSFYTCV